MNERLSRVKETEKEPAVADGGREIDVDEPEPVRVVRTVETPLGRVVLSNGEIHADREVALGAVGVALGLGVVAGMVVAR